MKEHDRAIILANRVLDRPNADPDDDLAVLARQLLRREERLERAEGALREIIESEQRCKADAFETVAEGIARAALEGK